MDGAQCYKFERIPTGSGPHYAKLVYWADKEKFVTKRVDYHENNELLKRLMCYDFQLIDGHWTAMKLVMANL